MVEKVQMIGTAFWEILGGNLEFGDSVTTGTDLIVHNLGTS